MAVSGEKKNATSDLILISANCNANADFLPVASGGDGSAVQFCKLQFYLERFWRLTPIRLGYVGFSPSQQTVIVAHQGTVPSKMHARRHSWKSNIAYVIFFSYSEADATDVEVPLQPLNPTLFPGISSSIEAHSGFANEQAKYASAILYQYSIFLTFA